MGECTSYPPPHNIGPPEFGTVFDTVGEMVQLIDNFITEQEEQEILGLIKMTSVKRGEGRNTITRYGSILPYKAGVTPIIPTFLEKYAQRIHSQHLTTDVPDSIAINEYLPTQSIDWHIDSRTSGPIIVVLSLMSEAVMGLRYDKARRDIILPPRSLLLLSGEERTIWEHCIYPVKKRRYSIIFRKGTL